MNTETAAITGILKTWTGGAFDWSSGHTSKYGKAWNGQEIQEVYLGCCCHTVPSLPATAEDRLQAAIWQAKQDAHAQGLKNARNAWNLAHLLERGIRVQVDPSRKGRVKNKGAFGVLKLTGVSAYGAYALIILEDGSEVFSKPEYLLVLSPYWIEETFVPNTQEAF